MDRMPHIFGVHAGPLSRAGVDLRRLFSKWLASLATWMFSNSLSA